MEKIILDMTKPVRPTKIEGMWRNITGRNQIVKVDEVTKDSVFYIWEESTLNRKVFVKSIDHFLRSYQKI